MRAAAAVAHANHVPAQAEGQVFDSRSLEELFNRPDHRIDLRVAQQMVHRQQ